LRNIERETAQMLAVFVRAMAARRVLELGTSNGYSTLWLADAVAGVRQFVDERKARTGFPSGFAAMTG